MNGGWWLVAGGWWNTVCKVQAFGKCLQNFATGLVQAITFQLMMKKNS